MSNALLAYWGRLPGNLRGIVLMLLSTVGFASMHTLIRIVSAEIHPIQIAFFRNFFGLIVFLPWFLKFGFAPLRTRRLPLHGLRAVLNVCAMFAFFTALSVTPLAQVTALAFTAPIFAALLAILVLRESVRLRRWIAIACGFLGTLVILRPGLAAVDTGSLLVLFSAMLWGSVLIVIRVLGRTESSLTITSYMNILVAVLSFVPALLVWSAPSAEAWAGMVAIGVLGTLAQLAVAQSLKEAETAVVMPFDFCKLIWISIFGFVLFREVPDVFVWTGAAIIFGSASYIAYRERRAVPQAVPTPPQPHTAP